MAARGTPWPRGSPQAGVAQTSTFNAGAYDKTPDFVSRIDHPRGEVPILLNGDDLPSSTLPLALCGITAHGSGRSIIDKCSRL
jgi:hypothetical protein